MTTPLDFVCPTQGTASERTFSNGNTLPIVSPPFAMNSWVPETFCQDGHEGSWFYRPWSHNCYGIRCSHQPSPWIGDYGAFSLMPQVGPVIMKKNMRFSFFRPDELDLRPDYLRVNLRHYETTVELCPTERAAVLRIRFPAGAKDCRLFFDSICPGDTQISVDEAGRCLRASLAVERGTVPAAYRFHTHLTVDCPIGSWTFFDVDGRAGQETGVPEGHGSPIHAYLDLTPPDDGIVTLRIGTSWIDDDHAARNLQREVGDRSLEAVRTETAAKWNDWLGRLEIEGATEDQRKTFMTCLYRVGHFPRPGHEINAKDELVHRSPYDGEIHSGPLYTDNGFWDTHRTVYSLLSLLAPRRLGEILQGWVNACKEGDKNHQNSPSRAQLNSLTEAT